MGTWRFLGYSWRGDFLVPSLICTERETTPDKRSWLGRGSDGVPLAISRGAKRGGRMTVQPADAQLKRQGRLPQIAPIREPGTRCRPQLTAPLYTFCTRPLVQPARFFNPSYFECGPLQVSSAGHVASAYILLLRHHRHKGQPAV